MAEVIKSVRAEGKMTITTGDGETIEVDNPEVLVVSDGRRSFSLLEKKVMATLIPLPKPQPKEMKEKDING